MNSKTAQAPIDELSEKEDIHSYLCQTCWRTVIQPCIRGLWYHWDEWQQKSFQCNNLIPVPINKINRDKICLHHFKASEFMKGGLKCIKCGYPQRVDLLSHENFQAQYYCFDCKKSFKILSQHAMKIHKGKGFEFERRPLND